MSGSDRGTALEFASVVVVAVAVVDPDEYVRSLPLASLSVCLLSISPLLFSETISLTPGSSLGVSKLIHYLTLGLSVSGLGLAA